MKAPSEKHLEDWIVNNPTLFTSSCGDESMYPFIDSLVGRQVRLPCGIADLLAVYEDQFIVVELKRGDIDEAVLGQTLRYMADLKRIWRQALFYAMEHHDPDDYCYWQTANFSNVCGGFPEIGGYIVGHSVTKQAIVDAAHGAGIDIFLYNFRDEQYTFDMLSPSIGEQHMQTIQDFGYGYIGEAMRGVMRRRTNDEKKRLA